MAAPEFFWIDLWNSFILSIQFQITYAHINKEKNLKLQSSSSRIEIISTTPFTCPLDSGLGSAPDFVAASFRLWLFYICSYKSNVS
jgi:hypothetical protein